MSKIFRSPLQFLKNKLLRIKSEESVKDAKQIPEHKIQSTGCPPKPGSSVNESYPIPVPEQNKSDASTRSHSSDNQGSIAPQVSIEMRRMLKIEQLLSAQVINLEQLKHLTWNGISFERTDLRAKAWRVLLGYSPTTLETRNSTLNRKRQEYKQYVNENIQDSEEIPFSDQLQSGELTSFQYEQLKQILNDIKRTMPGDPFFELKCIRDLLTRVLYIWSLRHPASGYVQGFNDLCIPFLCVFLAEHVTPFYTLHTSKKHKTFQTFDPQQIQQLFVRSRSTLDNIEADVYYCLNKVLAQIQDNYTAQQPGCVRMLKQLESMIATADPELHQKLVSQEVQMAQVSFRWINCFLMRQFSIRNVIRLWDAYLSEEGDDGFAQFHVYVCTALMLHWGQELKQKDMCQIMLFLQDMPTEQWGEQQIAELLAKSYQLMMLYHGAKKHLKSTS